VQGRFEIISLSGSFHLAEDGDTRSRTGGLSVALAGSDGRVLGGCVAGMLLAATPVQVCGFSFSELAYAQLLHTNHLALLLFLMC
jgi:predicted DNA-binding protein with PD1-like motif